MKTFYSGLDIGGANIKVYDGDVKIFYFPMWKKWKELREFLEGLNLSKVGVVLTAELADCFKSKSEGVLYIAKIVKDVFDEAYFIDLDGNIKSEIDIPEKFAANNWIASVKYLSQEFDDFIFADMGSTTTDIIPVKGREIKASKTDFERLKRKELLYFGMLRTPTFFLMKENCSSEFFSIVADIMIILDRIDESEYTCETPDGRGKSREECLQRFARQFCADLEEVGEDFLVDRAEKIFNEMVLRVSNALKEKMEAYGIETVVGCGIGEIILKEAAESEGLEYISVKERYGRVSDIFPAFAIAKLVEHDRR